MPNDHSLFVGNERKVSVTGKAYFEVAHDVSKPFVVHNGPMDVQVLGTSKRISLFLCFYV